MSEFGNNFSFNILTAIKNFGKPNKQQEIGKKINQLEKDIKVDQSSQSTPKQSLTNTNSNIPLNQQTLTSPGLNQIALNSTNQPQIILTSNTKNTLNNQSQQAPAQINSQGAKDLPAYAGISNMSLKSWIAGHDNKNMAKMESAEKQLTATLGGIKGFQRQNYEGSEGDPDGNRKQKGFKFPSRNKALLILSHIFSNIEQSSTQETDLLVNLMGFKKLGSSLKEKGNDAFSEEISIESKLSPPVPTELLSLEKLDPLQIKYLHQLLALPSEFPEFLRLFANDKVELNSKQLNSFLLQRLEIAQSQNFGGDSFLNTAISNFIPLLNPNNYSLLLPIMLLYYPLPPPMIIEKFNFEEEWEKKKKKEKKESELAKPIATCEIYYVSKARGRFLLKFELNQKQEFSFDVQTSPENNGIVKDLELAIVESMFLLECPPALSELNVMLTEQVYKATDLDEELSIISSGPIRLEIILAVYSALIVLNKLSHEPDPGGLIEMSE